MQTFRLGYHYSVFARRLRVSKLGAFLGNIQKGRKLRAKNRTRAILVGSGDEARALFRQVNDAAHFRLAFAHYCDTKTLSASQVISWVKEFVRSGSASVVVLDVHDAQILSILPELYALSFEGVCFIDQQVIKEEINERIFLPDLSYAWLVEHISRSTHKGFSAVKRFLDLLVAIPLFVISIPLYIPIVILLRRDGGSAFLIQEYVGKNNRKIYLAKFRTMNTTDTGTPSRSARAHVAKFEKCLRKSHLDALPKLFSVITGDLSLIGPCPKVPTVVAQNVEGIPHYSVRHFVTPGLLGWAQVHDEKFPLIALEADEELAYDLYYVRHRSLTLDLKIMLRALRVLILRVIA